jgi:acyl-coenzyme A synthetase/AMP-(fatty) acid ligase
VENELYRHPDVALACVIGVPDQDQVERVKAFVVLKDRARESPKGEGAYRPLPEDAHQVELPEGDRVPRGPAQDAVGKVAYKELENQEVEKLRAEGKYTGGR